MRSARSNPGVPELLWPRKWWRFLTVENITVIVHPGNQLIAKSAAAVLDQMLALKNGERRDSSIGTCKTHYTATETWRDLVRARTKKVAKIEAISQQKRFLNPAQVWCLLELCYFFLDFTTNRAQTLAQCTVQNAKISILRSYLLLRPVVKLYAIQL